MQKVTVKDAKKYFRIYRDADIPLVMLGPPGLGKTDIAHQFAEESKAGLLSFRIGDKDVIDFKGLPDNYEDDNGKKFSRFLPAEFIERLEGLTKQYGSAILFLDEMLQGPRAVQIVVQQILNENRIGEHKLPDRVWKLAASNRMSDKASVVSPSMPTANRAGWIEVVPDHQAWHEWALANGILPELVAFFKTRPEELFATLKKGFNELYTTGEWAYASPRSAANLSRLVEKHGEYDLTLCCSILGDAVGSQVFTFAKHARKLPDLSWLDSGDVAEAKKCKCPEEPDLQYVAMYSVLHNTRDAKQVEAALMYMQKFPREHYSVFTQELVTKLPSAVLVLSRLLK